MSEKAYYPTNYKAPLARRFVAIIHMIFVLILALVGRGQLDSSSSKLIWIIAIIGITVAIVFKYIEVSSCITVYADRIEKKSWLSKKMCRRDEAVGIWINSLGGFSIIRKHSKGGNFSVPAGIERDASWNDWLQGVPDLSKYSKSTKDKFVLATLIIICFGALVLSISIFSFLSFRGKWIIETGNTVAAKVLSVKNNKNSASGLVEYRLANGKVCYDWTELALNGSVQPGDEIPMVVDRACDHSVSTKKPLYPWLFLSMSMGMFLTMVYQLWRLYKRPILKVKI